MKNTNFESGIEKKKTFRELVSYRVQNNSLFPLVEVGNGQGKMSVLDAIEKDKVVLYLELCGYQELNLDRHDAIHNLTVIYDELQNKEPDQAIIDAAIAKL